MVWWVSGWFSVRIMGMSGIAGDGVQPGFPVRQYYNVTMSVYCHKLVLTPIPHWACSIVVGDGDSYFTGH